MPGHQLIEHAIVVTMDDELTVYDDGAVLLVDDRIADVGPGHLVRDRLTGPPDRVIDARGMAALPGLIDLHYHSSIGKGWSDHLPLWESLERFWYPMIRALDDEAAYWAAMLSYADSVRSGTTTVNDMFRRLNGLAAAAERIGIRAVLSNDVADAEHGLDTLSDVQEAYAAHHGASDGRVEVYVGIEWLPLASEGLLRDCRALADDLGTGIHIHLNESLTEVENSRQRFGRRPTEVAYDCGILGRDCIAAHCVWLSDTEIALMRETGTQISHNPISNAKLGNGIARLPEMLAAGLNVGLGHDAAESSNTRDLFRVMSFASLVHRAARVDSSVQQPPGLLTMATRAGAQALGHPTGRLEPGRKGDLILVDLRNTAFVPLVDGNHHQLLSHLTFAATGADVDTTIVDGHVLMEGRRLTTVDEEEIVREANKTFLRVLETIPSAREVQ